MTDFVTRLETELRAAALRREAAGRVRGVAIPRLRAGVSGLPAAALASALLGLAVLGVALMLASSPERPAHANLPAALQGVWRHAPTELRLYTGGSDRCGNLGVGREDACYTIGSATGVAQSWGRLSVSGDELTLRSVDGGEPGLYRWRTRGRTLALTEVRDPVDARAKALAAPLTQVRESRSRARVPFDWTERSFTSERYGYSIRFSGEWSSRAAPSAGRPDTFSRDPGGSALPEVAIRAEDLPSASTPARWDVAVRSRTEGLGCVDYSWRRLIAAGERVRITTYASCAGTSRQTASFVHGRRGYSVLWRGRRGHKQVDADAPLFDAMLRTLVLSP